MGYLRTPTCNEFLAHGPQTQILQDQYQHRVLVTVHNSEDDDLVKDCEVVLDTYCRAWFLVADGWGCETYTVSGILVVLEVEMVLRYVLPKNLGENYHLLAIAISDSDWRYVLPVFDPVAPPIYH
jgi:hypothetical protein